MLGLIHTIPNRTSADPEVWMAAQKIESVKLENLITLNWQL
jgi:hypothetical protein